MLGNGRGRSEESAPTQDDHATKLDQLKDNTEGDWHADSATRPAIGRDGQVGTAHFMEDRAYELITAGWPVFPLRAKVPLISKADGGRGHLDATLDDRQVERWWTDHPTANIGARVPKHLIVIDIDPRSGGDIRALGDLPPTLTVYSGRGEGQHLYFQRPWGGPVVRNRLPRGIDLKDHDRYCVMPPSPHPEGKRQAYRWGDHHEISILPAHVAELLRPPVREREIIYPREHVPNLAGLLRKVATAETGNRNNCLYWGACTLVDQGQGGNLVVRHALTEAGRACGLSDQEILSTMRSAGFQS
jgi:hypothetical protein